MMNSTGRCVEVKRAGIRIWEGAYDEHGLLRRSKVNFMSVQILEKNHIVKLKHLKNDIGYHSMIEQKY